MPVRHPAVRSLPAALLSLAATLAVSIAFFLTACGGSSAANQLSSVSGAQGFAAISNVPGAPYSWTDSSGNTSDGQSYASNRTGAQLNDLWEFKPTTELWSWVSGSSTQNEIYLAAMPELSPTANAWTWASGSNTADTSGIYAIASVSNIPGARYGWTDSSGDFSVDQLYASNRTSRTTAQLNDSSEFNPAAETWSWVSGSSAQNEIYLASMPELSPSADTWTWVSGSTEGVVAASNAPGVRCHSVAWVESGGNSWLSCGDDLQANASLNDLWRYGP